MADTISSLAVHTSGDVLAAAGSHVYITSRAKLVGTLSTPADGLSNVKPKANGKARATDESSEESEDDESEMELDTAAHEGPRIAQVIVFGDQVVGLANAGDCMIVWDFAKRGACVDACSDLELNALQSTTRRSRSRLALGKHQRSSIRRPTSTRSSSAPTMARSASSMSARVP